MKINMPSFHLHGDLFNPNLDRGALKFPRFLHAVEV